MKILLSSDFHGDFTRFYQIVDKIDICICCGDIFDYHQLPNNKFSFPVPFYSIKGNKETWGKVQEKIAKYSNFFWLNDHLKYLEQKTGLYFFGIDYFSEPISLPNNIDVLISHQPAFGLADQCNDPYNAKMIKYCGNKIIRKLVDKYHPKYLISGHVHKYQQARNGNTIAITLAPSLNPPIFVFSGVDLVTIS